MALSRVREAGAFATLGIVAPLPVAESGEAPKEFIATTLAFTDALYASEKGDSRRTEAGMLHAVFNFTVALFTPSQFTDS